MCLVFGMQRRLRIQFKNNHDSLPSSKMQSLHALILTPPIRYRHTAYHKQTKNQWARDDPAYVIICCLLVAVAASAFCVA